LRAETQNNNESLNSLIWTFAPKTLHSGSKIDKLATFLAVIIIIFNDGFKGVAKVMETLGLKIGLYASNYAYKMMIAFTAPNDAPLTRLNGLGLKIGKKLHLSVIFRRKRKMYCMFQVLPNNHD